MHTKNKRYKKIEMRVQKKFNMFLILVLFIQVVE